MLFPEEHAAYLKAWIMKRLENTSDADTDVLADYVLALLRHDGTPAQVRALCEAEIPEILGNETQSFLTDIFEAIQYQSYLPGAPPPPKRQSAPQQSFRAPVTPNQLPNPAPFQPIQRQIISYEDAVPGPVPPLGPSGNGSRKRSWQQRGDVDAVDATPRGPQQGGRVFKQARRGGRFSDRMGRPEYGAGAGPFPTGASHFDPAQQQQPQQPLPNFSNDPSDMPPFDPNAAMQELLRLQRSMGMNLPMVPNYPPLPGGTPTQGKGSKKRRRCRDFDKKGYCMRGPECKFEHVTDTPYVPPLPVPQGPSLAQPTLDEYDPHNAALAQPGANGSAGPQPAPPFDPQMLNQLLFMERQQATPHKKRDRRAPFSHEGPMKDKSQTTIVIEQIPEEYFSEEEVRGYFSQFGNVVEVSMQPYKHLAILKYDSWASAHAAWKSPQAVFGNRFVKVYWFKDNGKGIPASRPLDKSAAKGGSHSTNGHGIKDELTSEMEVEPVEEIDMAEFARKQEEAQKLHEERDQKLQVIEKQKQDVDVKRTQLDREIAEMKAQILAKQGGSNQTGRLKAVYEQLQQEALRLGITEKEDQQGDWPQDGGYPASRGRGGFWRGYAPRASPRGSFRGRGGQHAAYAQYSLDNRPKKVMVTGLDFTESERDETLRQFLLGVGEFTDVENTSTSTTITFKDRKTAEKFFYPISTNNMIPGIKGQVELAWISSDGTPVATVPSTPSSFVGFTNGSNGSNGNNGSNGSATATTESKKAESKPQQTSSATVVDKEAPEEGSVNGEAAGSGDDKDVAFVLQHPHESEQGREVDYDVADENDWDKY